MARKVDEIDKKSLNRYVSPPKRQRSLGTPTPERRAKEPDDLDTKIERLGTVYCEPEISYKAREPVDLYRKHFTEEEVAAAVQFCKDATIVMSQMITSRYDGMSRSGGGPRHGGVPDHHRDSYERFNQVLERLTAGDKRALVALVVGLRNEQTGQQTPIHEIARQRGANYGDQASQSKVGVGLLKAALEHAYEAYRKVGSHNRKAPARALPQRQGLISRSRSDKP